MKVILASDHAGIELRQELVALLKERGTEFQDLGPQTRESVDYPDFASRVAQQVVSEPGTLGVLVCGTGIGMSIVANKHRGIRAALCTSEFEARMTRAHNDANVLCLGQRVVGAGVARGILEAFLSTAFEGGRHEKRVQKIRDVEAQQR
ncbi:ribose 5-phosphate isomerase B [Corallococcus sp. AB049A]|uniref:Ribose 5-phosphate isomerase B n=1 Tax=Corallococcus interemptor TaxID=2316720 RepID=A0A3A8Q8M6_9BACT|nr:MULTISPECIES: ribose 5-phosphate isomerase B [Corallococcus]RKH45564.1 ribose 5-phosphate isomerase B [Corallococcus sp. AB050B]RKH65029.1 ribose 5-phosphate isomerase B [Corallococcus interemptor]RKI57938.1 ribose 5-phosphate isomerase B [Corallococcus sp. AB049A]